ncbi:MAG: glutamate--tRNA ligase, partial [Myxococcales bacterium]|nr:glutamate--tRNA ligase [Myxococcales bacterium]
FNWAFARYHAGEMRLRSEDTDRERSTKAAEDAVLEGLHWLGIDWDGDVVRQSGRAELYEAAVERMIAEGAAYRCTCSKESLETRKQETIARGDKWTYDGRCRDAAHGPDCGEHTVRIRLAESGLLGFDDLVFGPSGQDASEIGDRIIRRSDGGPLYHLAVVVDDIEMGISHVIRGADHLNNTSLQIAIYRALGADPPDYAHLPLLVGAGGKKLSKRRDPVSIQHFRDEGYLPEALISWLARLGWSHGDQEIFTREEIVSLFQLEDVHKSNAQADVAKLTATNQHWIKALPLDQIWPELEPHLEAVAGHPVSPSTELDRLLELLRERSETLRRMAEQTRFFLCDEITRDEKASAKHLKPAVRAPLADLTRRLEGVFAWDLASIEAAFQETLAAHEGLKLGKLAQPVRVAVTGSAASPPIYDTLAILGAKRTVARLKDALENLPASD